MFNPDYNVVIDFLTDYSEADTVYHPFTRDLGTPSNAFVIQNSLNKQVTIGRCNVICNACLTLSNINIQSSDGTCLQANKGGIVCIKNTVSLNQISNNTCAVFSHGGRCFMNTNSTLNLSPAQNSSSGILLSNQGVFEHVNTTSVSFTINVKTSLKSLFVATDKSAFLTMWDCSVNADEGVEITEKVKLSRGSCMITKNRGNAFIPGDGTVSIDETSLFI